DHRQRRSHFPKHPLDDAVRADRRGQIFPGCRTDVAVAIELEKAAEPVRRARHDDGVDDRNVPDRMGAHDRPASLLHGSRTHRVRLGFAVVWRPTVANRSAVAVTDPRGERGSLGLSIAHATGAAAPTRSKISTALTAPPRPKPL